MKIFKCNLLTLKIFLTGIFLAMSLGAQETKDCGDGGDCTLTFDPSCEPCEYDVKIEVCNEECTIHWCYENQDPNDCDNNAGENWEIDIPCGDDHCDINLLFDNQDGQTELKCENDCDFCSIMEQPAPGCCDDGKSLTLEKQSGGDFHVDCE